MLMLIYNAVGICYTNRPKSVLLIQLGDRKIFISCDICCLLAEEELIIPDPTKGKKAIAAVLKMKSKKK